MFSPRPSNPASAPTLVPPPRRIAYLSAGSGGAHHASARALASLATDAFGDGVEQHTVDLYDRGWIRSLPFLARVRAHSDALWRAFYNGTDHRSVVRALSPVVRALYTPRLRARLPFAPDLLVATHFSTAHCLDALARSFPVRPRTAVVMLDYEPHHAWFAEADCYVVASDAAVARAREVGIAPERVVRIPLLPCRSAATTRAPSADGRLRVAAVAGADGTSASRLIPLLRRLDAGTLGASLVVDAVCGHGEDLRRSLTALARSLRHVELRVHGFVADLPDRLAAADVSLLRAGPMSVTESLTAGTPVVAFDWHAHEAPHARLVESLGAGAATRDPELAALSIERLAADPALLARWQHAALAAARSAPGAAFVERFFGPRLARSSRVPAARASSFAVAVSA